MNLFEINTKTCIQDGICAAVCPAGLIDFQKESYPKASPEAEEICIRCGHCVTACPTGSFSHIDIPVNQCPPIQKALNLSSEQCEHFLRSRRSIRVFKKNSVSKDTLSKLIEVSRYAPSGHNSQCVEWLVLTNKDELNNFSVILAEWMHWIIDNMTEFAKSMHMDRTLTRWENGKDVFLRGAPVLIVTHAQKNNPFAQAACTIALTYLELSAMSMGLGCCWAGYFNAAANTFPKMMEALSLPLEHQCFGAMMLGYPKFTYHRLPLRKTPNIIWR
ncbi:MAG: nitroreductase family protein [Desulfobacterales bacterium]|nr:nitroreductase family protein [Desulfobacterales bacterium]